MGARGRPVGSEGVRVREVGLEGGKRGLGTPLSTSTVTEYITLGSS